MKELCGATLNGLICQRRPVECVSVPAGTPPGYTARPPYSPWCCVLLVTHSALSNWAGPPRDRRPARQCTAARSGSGKYAAVPGGGRAPRLGDAMEYACEIGGLPSSPLSDLSPIVLNCPADGDGG